MAERKASEVFVECLEAEGVRYVFGIPGEETLDLSESLANSSIEFVPVRHEQGGAYMADAVRPADRPRRRLPGDPRPRRDEPGHCRGRRLPGSRSRSSPSPGQSDIERMHKESHQYIDLIGILRPIVKWNARVSSPEIVPEVVRKAFAVAESEKPGADPSRAARGRDGAARSTPSPLPRHAPVQPEPGGKELQRAADLIDGAQNPMVLAGNGAVRGHAGRALRAFVHNTGIPVAETFMAKGLVDYEDPKALGTVGLQARDYEMAGFDDADLVIAIGYDLVEHSPKHWNPRRDKKIVMIDSVAAEIDQYFVPDVELIGDIAHVLARLAAACTPQPDHGRDVAACTRS